MSSDGDRHFSGHGTLSTVSTGLGTTFDDAPGATRTWVTTDSTATETRTVAEQPCSTIDTIGMDASDDPEPACLEIATIFHDPDQTESWTEAGSAKAPPPRRKSHLPDDFVPGFQIESELGRGGMGIVYKAWQLQLKRYVALKMIRDDRVGNPQNLARFAIEAEALARLDHPNIVKIFQIGKAGGAPFVTLECLEGGTLARRSSGAPQPVREAAALLATLAKAIHAAHLADIVHRDLKPSNILFGHDGIPKITDFGLAKRTEAGEGETQSGQVLGTPSYMAPEQAQGWGPELGRAVDIYSLGAILYEMLTGRPPHKGVTSEETLQLVLKEEPLVPSHIRPKIPFDLETICLKCLAREPHKRYADAHALAEDLQRFLDGKTIQARRTPFWERGWKQVKRRPVTSVLLAIGILAAAAALGYLWYAHSLAQIEEQNRNHRLANLRGSSDQTLFKAQKSLAGNQWDDARLAVADVITRIEHEPLLADVRERASTLLEQAVRGSTAEKAVQAGKKADEEARARVRRFLETRDEALFRQANFVGLDASERYEATLHWALEGLRILGVEDANGDWSLSPLPPSLSLVETQEVERGFHELLMVLANAVAHVPGKSPESRADDALRLVDLAARLQPSVTRAALLQRADYLELKGDQDAAKSELAKAEATTPADASDLFLTGLWLSRHGDWAAAKPLLETAAQREPGHFWTHFQLAFAHFMSGEYAKAQLGLIICLQQKRDYVWIYLVRGIVSTAAAGKTRQPGLEHDADALLQSAVSDYRIALGLVDDGPEAGDLRYALLVNRGLIHLERNELSAAEADLRAATALNDRRFLAYDALGKVNQRRGRIAEAHDQFTKAIARKPERGQLYRNRAVLIFDLENATPTQCLAAVKDLEESSYRDAAESKLVAEDRARQAALLRRAGKFEDALSATEAAIKLDRGLVLAHQTRILCLLELERYDDMLASCVVALEAGKPTAELYELSGLAREKLGDSMGAVTDYTLALRLRPDDPHLLRRRGWSNLAGKSLPMAARDFDAAIRIDATSAEAYCGRAFARVGLGDHHAGVDDAEEALRLGPNDSKVSHRAARVYAQAAKVASHATRRPSPEIVALVERYRNRADALIQRCLDQLPAERRASFLHKTVADDPAFESIRRRLKALVP
jgi:eukaryotic-like serine/threonine-protein kinase